MEKKNLKLQAKESKKYFKSQLSEFVYYRSYSRWIEKEGRRETWVESVDRYIEFMKENVGRKLTDAEYEEVRQAILNQEVMPSMRLMWSAGKAARLNNSSAYNCSFISPSKIEDLAEILYLSMSGCGVGFSVENQTVQKFPVVKKIKTASKSKMIIEDSKEGWANAVIKGMKAWMSGRDIEFDYSRIRPSGERLYTMGGRSAGPEPLVELLAFIKAKVQSRQGKRLSALDVHDIICKIGEVVVMGGVRRTALISLSDLDDVDMRGAKTGQFYYTHPQRSMANNSAVYYEKPGADKFLEEWTSLIKSGTGERGIFNRGGIQHQVPKRRWQVLKRVLDKVGTNPCGEILLQSKQYCNLSEIIARHEDTEETFMRKARIATIIGTYQSSLTNFTFLSREWKQNCDEERLLGVSITGQWDSPLLTSDRAPELLLKMREYCVKVNKEYADRLGINPSTAITCVKPSGTVSQLVDASSGMHPRHAKFYIRRIRISATDPLFHMMKAQGMPYFPEVGQARESATTYVLEFPVRAPEGSVTKNDVSSIKLLEHWKKLKEFFTEHNPSVTISIGDEEWIEVANWLYQNWDMLGGLSFLPRENHVYQLAPFEEIDEKTYNDMVKKMPEINFAEITNYEKDDSTQGSKELACSSSSGCEI